MDNKDIQNTIISFLKEDAILALGALFMGLAVNLFSMGKVWECLIFLVMAGIVFFARAIMKADKQLKSMGVDMRNIDSDTIATTLEDRILKADEKSVPKKKSSQKDEQDI